MYALWCAFRHISEKQKLPIAPFCEFWHAIWCIGSNFLSIGSSRCIDAKCCCPQAISLQVLEDPREPIY